MVNVIQKNNDDRYKFLFWLSFIKFSSETIQNHKVNTHKAIETCVTNLSYMNGLKSVNIIDDVWSKKTWFLSFIS